jgi:hypothetical protein
MMDVKIVHCDVLTGGFNSLPDKSFDVIIDKSFMDVFLRQGRSKVVFKESISKLRDGGIFLAMSIFHKKWRNVLSKSEWQTMLYGSLDVRRFSRTRPNVSTFSNPIAVLVGQQRGNDSADGTGEDIFAVPPVAIKLRVNSEDIVQTELRMVDFYKVSVYEFPPDASVL